MAWIHDCMSKGRIFQSDFVAETAGAGKEATERALGIVRIPHHTSFNFQKLCLGFF